jgi:tetraacyldisaccharide 4'-kinase
MIRLPDHWQKRDAVSVALWPLSLLFGALVALRRALYRAGWLRSVRSPVPVIVVGNITVGGTGKTPLTIWLAQFLAQQGFRPGIVTRGYGGSARNWPLEVTAGSDAALAGDEPVLLARHAGCPVLVDPDRTRGAHALTKDGRCDVILSDDGLQHYRLARDVEIAVIDGARRFGNGWLLPAGPLREPPSRLASVDLRVVQGGVAGSGEFAMSLTPNELVRVCNRATSGLDSFRDARVHAVAGIGHPARFFATLRSLGMEVLEHPFPDHHRFVPGDLAFDDELPVIMTEKDAVKCQHFAESDWWYLAVTAEPDTGFGERLLKLL